MNKQTLAAAIDQAKRFLAVAKLAQGEVKDNAFSLYGSKQTAAAKRASMDLTRALSDMRKSG